MAVSGSWYFFVGIGSFCLVCYFYFIFRVVFGNSCWFLVGPWGYSWFLVIVEGSLWLLAVCWFFFLVLEERRNETKDEMMIVTPATWHVTCNMWHITCDMWLVTRGVRWTFLKNFSSQAPTVWEYQHVEPLKNTNKYQEPPRNTNNQSYAPITTKNHQDPPRTIKTNK